ncbi:MAG: tripartite tricarboxylate transporter TctB family protein [Rhodobacteraceae bacterium]|nr:tripartite tricarboxylate transporter TctB family protein [Paracoccaceae bacterium]
MRRGEIVTAFILAALSIYMMWKSTELDIGYATGVGPGGGSWPFWLSAVMLICTGCIAYNWARRSSPPSQSDEPVLDAEGLRMLIQVGGGIIGFVGLTSIISIYGAMALFLFYYVRILGRHSLALSLAITLLTPTIFFFFFEGLMRITLPKGLSFTDPFFNVLYDLIY